MPAKTLLVSCYTCILLAVAGALAADFPAPPGGWTYLYTGDQLIVGEDGGGWTSLDGTWTHDNNSDAWDGTAIGGAFVPGGGGFGVNSPGGASLGTQNSVGYLRMQDTGDPRDYGYADPNSRKVYFGHNIGSDIDPVKAQTIMRSGVTLTFRARIPTLAKAGPPLDPLHRDGQQANGVQSYPTNGDGYVTSDGGKGNFVIREGGNGGEVPAAAIAFSLTQTTDTTGGDPTTGQARFAGLTFNEFNGNVPSANVNFGQGSKTNVVAFDPTEWHELYIVIRDDPADIGTHEAFVFRDGILTPSVFKITGGTGADMNDSFLAMGGSATPQNWALDVDWFGYKDEAVFPPGAQLPPSLFNFVPANGTMFHPISGNFKFSVSALMPANTLPASGFKVSLNGQDISGQLALTGSDASKSRTATLSALQPNTIYTSTIIVTDSGGLSTTNEISFDTFMEAQAKFLEAEDYNHTSGQFMENPAPGSYGSLLGTEGVDFHDTTPASLGTYRTDEVDVAATTDFARAKFASAGQTDSQIGTIARGEWWNYSCTLASPPYNLWLRLASTAAQEIRVDRVTSDPSLPNQTLELLGILKVPRSDSLDLFTYAPLTDSQGQGIALQLSGKTTLRLTAIGANDDLALNFLLLMPASSAPGAPLVSTSPSAGATGVTPDAIVEAAIHDGSSAVDKNTVKLRVNGAEVAAVVTKAGSVTSVKFTPNPIWSAGATYALNLAFNGGTARSYDWSFTAVNYAVLTPAMKVANASTPGFVWRMHQNETNQETSLARAEAALAGSLGLPNLADPNSPGPASGPGTPANPGSGTMTFRIPTVINVSQDAGSAFGNFTPDEQMPGIPGTTSSTDGIAAEVRTFIQLPKGLITMGVNSDDGFQTTAGFLADTPLLLGEFNAGRGAGDTLFQFAVQEAGVYAFRTVWFEGGGDANLEWFMVNPNSSRVLINDTANGGAPSFQNGTVPEAPPPKVPLNISWDRATGDVVITWDAAALSLQESTDLRKWDNVAGSSPFRVIPTGPAKFYRLLVSQ